jgi:hypothetical protein
MEGTMAIARKKKSASTAKKKAATDLVLTS